MKRRSLLLSSFLIVGAEPLAFVRRLVSGARTWTAAAESSSFRESALVAGTLSQSEMETLVAFAEVLVEGRAFSPRQRGHFVDHIDDQADRGNLALYRTAVHLLDRLAGTRFSGLDFPRRIELMTRHYLVPSKEEPEEQLDALDAESRAVRTRAVPDIIRGYYRSPAGWAAVGYETFPGRCGDLAQYTRPPASGRGPASPPSQGAALTRSSQSALAAFEV